MLTNIKNFFKLILKIYPIWLYLVLLRFNKITLSIKHWRSSLAAFISLLVILSTFGQFLSINVNAASPGPFWSWNGSGVPTKIQNSENFDSIEIGGAFFTSPNLQDFYIARDGTTTYAWGANNFNQLGTGDNIDLTEPTLVPGLSNLTKASSGWYSSLGIKDDGTVLVWGGGYANPAQVSGVNNAVDIYMNGYDSGLIVDTSGNVYTVGNNPSSATLVPGLSNIVQVSTGFEGRYALDNLGQVWAWGGNSYGQLGDGTLNANSIPSIVQGLPQIKSIASGADNIMVLDINGDVWAWGSASQNQIGQGETQPNQTTPLKVLGLPPIKEVAMNGKSAKAVDFNQKVWEWGENRTGGQSNIPTNITSPASINLNMLADPGTIKSNGRITVAKRDLIVQAVLKITQSSSQNSVVANDNLTYTINYQNTGTVTATGIVITNDLLPDLNFVSCTGSCVNTGQNVTWNLPDLTAGSTGSVALTTSVSASVAAGKLSNTALISSSNAESNSVVYTVDVVPPTTPGLNINKTSDQSFVYEYSSFIYSIQYSNTLPTSVDNVVITDTLDPRLSISSLPGSCTSIDQDITCNLGTLNPGDSGLLDVFVNVNQGAAGGPLANTAIIDSDQTEPKAVANVITVGDPSINNPDLNPYQPLNFNKYVDRSSAFPSDTLYYTIEVYNPNSDGAYVTIQDVLDPRLNYNFDCSFSCSDSSSSINQALEWSFYISSNSTETLTYSAYLDSNAAPGDLWNTAIIDYYDNNSNYSGSKSSSVSTFINGDEFNDNGNTPPSPEFTLRKTASVSQVSPGTTFDYNIEVVSNGYEGNINFLDILDPRLDFINCNSCNANGQQITFSDYLGENNTNNYTITVQVKNQVAGGPLANTAFITRDGLSWNGNSGDSETKSSTSIIQVIVPPANASLQISKTSSNAIVERSDLYTYTLNYANIGSSTSTNTIVTDVLDPRLTFVSCSNSCSQNGQNLSWNLGNLGAGSVGNITVSVTVKNNAAPGILANIAQISSNETNPISGIAYVRIEQPVPVASININKTSNKTTALPGEQIVYTLNYQNIGNVDLTDGVISDQLDSRLDFVSCSSGCVQNGQTITWNLGTVQAGIDTVVTVTVTVKNNASLGILPNTGTFKTNETPQVSSTENVSIGSLVFSPLVVDKTASQPNVSQNSTYTYTINYQNPNNVPITDVVISDVLDNRLDFVSCSNSCTQAGQNLNWNIGNLAANASGSVIITVKVKNNAASGVLINTALAQSTETSQSSDSISVNVDAPAALQPMAVSKLSSQNDVNRNSTYTYTINYQNPNNVPITDVVISDVLDNRLDFVSCSNSCTQAGQNLNWNIGNLAANASGSVTVVVTVKNLAAYGILANTAILDSTETTGTSATNFVSVIPISVVAVPTISKTQNLTNVFRGNSIVYTVNYSNNSDVNFSNAVITDTLNSNLDFVSCSNSCTQSGQTLTWNIGSLAVGQSGSVTINVNVKNNATLGLLQNEVLISTSESPTVQAFSYGAIFINDPVLIDSISISKQASVSTATRGSAYNYILSYTNGPTALTNVTIEDVLDSRLSFATCSDSCTQSGQTIAWNIGNLAANATGSVTVSVTVNNSAQVGGLDNTASLDSSETSSVNSNKSTVAITIPDTPRLSITNTADLETVAPNQNVTYTINYSNTANRPVSNTVVTSVLDPNISFVSCSSSCTQSGQTISWNIGSLASNGSGTLSLVTQVSNLALNGLISNTATISSNETPNSNSTTSVAVVIPDTARLSLIKSSSTATANRTQNYSYTLNYQNGSIPVTNAIITDTLDSRLTFQTSPGCSASGQIVTCNIGNLASGAIGTRTINVTVNDNASIGGLDNIASIDSSETSPISSNITTVAIVTADNPSLNIIKTSNRSIVVPGENVIYTINYTNTADQPTTGITVTDVLDSNFTLISPCIANCNYNLGTKTLTYNIGNLAVGASGSITIEVQVANSTPNSLINNTATIDSDQTGSSSSNVAVAVIENIPASISLVKSSSASTLRRGDSFTYTISYANTNVPVTNVNISDILNSNLSFVSCSASCSQAGQTISWNLGNLAANQSGSVSISVQVKADSTLGSIDNIASIDSDETAVKNASTKIAVIIDDPAPILNLAVTSDKTTLNPGQNISYSVNYSNPSSETVTNTQITTILEPGLSLVTPCNTICTQTGQTIVWNIGNLPGGTNGNLSFEVTVDNNFNPGLLTNVINITSTESVPTSFTTAVAVLPVIAPVLPNLSVSKSTSQFTVFRGNNVSYNINYQNGLIPVTNAIVSDTLDSRLTFVSCNNSCVQSGQVITWNVGDLAANQSGTLYLTVQVSNTAALGNIDNTASIISNQTTSNSSTSRIALIINDPTPSFSILKSASASNLEPGSNAVFTINYSNQSTQNATNVTITDILDNNLTFVSCSNSCIQNGQNITWNFANLNAGASGTASINTTVKVSSPNALINNTASIQAVGFNPATSTASIAVARAIQMNGGTTLIQKQDIYGSNLNILKTADKKVAQPGEKVMFNIKFSNDGPKAIQNVEIEDSISRYLNILECSDKCLIDGQIVTWKIGAVASGESRSITLITQVKPFPSVLGVNSSLQNQNPSNQVSKVDLSESKAIIKGDNTLSESSVAAVAVFDITAGTPIESKKTEDKPVEDIIKPILVRTGSSEARNSQLIYIVLQVSILGFVYLSLLERKIKKD